MPGKFRIFSTDISPTLDPSNALPAPATLVVFDQDPLFGRYEYGQLSKDRGSIIKTFGGAVIQDFGVKIIGETITLSDSNALSQQTVSDLEACYNVVDGKWYFTDGYNCWKVQFSRDPRGFYATRNLLFAAHSVHIFSYTIVLLVLEKGI